MTSLAQVLIAAGIGGGSLVAVRLIEPFELPAMAYWTIRPDALAFVSACSGVVLGYSRPRMVKARWLRLGLGLVVLCATFFWYDALAGTEPTLSMERWHKLQSYVAFPACHAAYGYVVAPLARFFAESLPKGKKGAGEAK
jgi:hypothetical protein